MRGERLYLIAVIRYDSALELLSAYAVLCRAGVSSCADAHISPAIRFVLGQAPFHWTDVFHRLEGED